MLRAPSQDGRRPAPACTRGRTPAGGELDARPARIPRGVRRGGAAAGAPSAALGTIRRLRRLWGVRARELGGV